MQRAMNLVYVVSIASIVFVYLLCFRVGESLGRIMYWPYRAVGLAGNRATFVNRFGSVLRLIGGAMIGLILLGLGLRVL